MEDVVNEGIHLETIRNEAKDEAKDDATIWCYSSLLYPFSALISLSFVRWQIG